MGPFATDDINPGNFTAHLERTYNIRVNKIAPLGTGVFRIERESGAAWVARIFSETRPVQSIKGDAEILSRLALSGFPAERLANEQAVSHWEEKGVLVTEYVEGHQAKGSIRMYEILGELLGRLHTHPTASGSFSREGGAWHGFGVEGGPREVIDAALSLLRNAREKVPAQLRGFYETLTEELSLSDDFHNLPQAFSHPDLVPPNIIVTPKPGIVVVDWTGAGMVPRIFSLGSLLWTAGWADDMRRLQRVDAVFGSYRKFVELSPEEISRLYAAIVHHPFIFDVWSLCSGRKALPEVTKTIEITRQTAQTIALRVTDALKG